MKFEPLNFHNNNELVLVGRKAVIDTINNPILVKKISKIILAKSQTFLLNLAQKHHIVTEMQTKNWFVKKFKEVNHQFACVILKSNQNYNLEQFLNKIKHQEKALVLFLDQLQDPYNFGAILRTAAAAKVDGIVIKKRNQVPLNATVLKVSAGAGLLIPVISVHNLNQALVEFKQAGFWSYATMLDKTAKVYNQVEYTDKVVLIMGNEGDGISHLLASESDFKVYIPITENVDSLNVSVATAIMIYQIKL